MDLRFLTVIFFLINGASDFDFGDTSGQICALILTVCLTRLPHLKCFRGDRLPK